MDENEKHGYQEARKRILAAELERATVLDLSWLGLTALPPEIGRLTNLHKLILFNNRLTNLAPEIGGLTNLQTLDLTANDLTTLPPEIGRLTNLENLSLGSNRLSALPPEIGGLTSLQTLRLAGNGLTALPPEIGGLTSLQSLDLRLNGLTALPPEIGGLMNLQGLYLHGNDALGIPPEVLGARPEKVHPVLEPTPASPKAILDHYFATRGARGRPLNEAKLILVGEGDAGKTTLRKQLTHGQAEKGETKTRGIEITPWSVKLDGETIQANVWDFGGQEIMQPTHQIFLTTRSIYLLVLDSRRDERANRLEYWLKTLASFAKGSPTIVVCNTFDEHAIDLGWTALREKYPFILDFVKDANCLTGRNVDEVRALVDRALRTDSMKHVRDRITASQDAIKKELEARKRGKGGSAPLDRLSMEEFRGICEGEGVRDEQERSRLLKLLHDLGVMLHFDGEGTMGTTVLNPEWVTSGVYQILNDPELLRRRDGKVGRKDLARIFGEAGLRECYQAGEWDFLLAMMRQFELAFRMDGGDVHLLPDLLSKDTTYMGDWESALRFQIKYTALPPSVMTRFIVRTHADIVNRTYWKHGVVIESKADGCVALVESDEEEGTISIRVKERRERATPDGAKRRRFLHVIRDQFRHINSTPERKGVEERVPLPDNPKATVAYAHLCKLEERGEGRYFPEGAERDYSVPELLDGIEEKENRMKPTEERDPRARPESEARRVAERRSLWGDGSFLLVAYVVILGGLVEAFNRVPWYAFPFIAIAAILLLGYMSIFLLLRGDDIREKGYLEALRDFNAQLPILKYLGGKKRS